MTKNYGASAPCFAEGLFQLPQRQMPLLVLREQAEDGALRPRLIESCSTTPLIGPVLIEQPGATVDPGQATIGPSTSATLAEERNSLLNSFTGKDCAEDMCGNGN